MSNNFPDVPNYAPLALRLSLKGKSIKKVLMANAVTFKNTSITPGVIVAMSGVVLLPLLSEIPDSYWLEVNVAAFFGLFLLVRKLMLPKYIQRSIASNSAYLRTAIEVNFIDEVAVLISDTAKSQYAFSGWRNAAEPLRAENPYLYCATVLAHKPSLWDSASSAVYSKLMASVPSV